MDRFLNRIIHQCNELLAGNAETQRAAYRWLRHCRPFRTVLSELQRQGFTFFQVARMLSNDAHGGEAGVALCRLERALIDTNHHRHADVRPAKPTVNWLTDGAPSPVRN